MFSLFRRRRRKVLLAAPITDQEQQRANKSLWQFRFLPTTLQENIIRCVRVLLAEKNWEGCKGLQLTDSMRWIIAAGAALCIPPGSDWYFDDTESILVYPEAYVAEVKPSIHSQFEIYGEFARSGETIYKGPVIVNWRDAQQSATGPNGGHHLVIHEFAHQLDMVNGRYADGLPPLASHLDSDKWLQAMKTELNFARQMVHNGQRVYINDYGLSSQTEFFAVASEYFFQTPFELAHYHPGVYQRLKEFYNIDLCDFLQDASEVVN